MKVWCRLFFALSIFLSSGPLWAEGRQKAIETLFESLQSPWLQLSDERENFFASFWQQHPSGAAGPMSEACRWKNRPQPALGDFADFRAKFETYDQQCRAEFQNGVRSFVGNMEAALLPYLDTARHPYGRHVILNLPNGVRLQGFLALHDDRPRPLVIFRNGIFSDSIDFSERFSFMQIFEQGPFNMLVLESMSGRDYLLRNKRRSFAGLDEGVQMLQILRRLRDPREPLHRLIDGIHLSGISMGGSGQLLAFLLQAQQKGAPWIQSEILLCPLLNIHETLSAHLSDGIDSLVMNYSALSRLRDLPTKGLHEGSFLQDLIEDVVRDYRGPVADEPWIVWPPKLAQVKREFWKANSFWNQFPDVSTPLWIMATKHDPFVPYALNAGRIASGEEKLAATNFMLTTFSEAYHCTMTGAYDWGESASWMQSFFRTFSPNLKMQKIEKNFALDSRLLDFIRANGWHPRMTFDLPVGGTEAVVKLSLLPSDEPFWWQIWMAPVQEFRLPLRDFDFRREDPVKTDAEQDLYRRWLNQNLEASQADDSVHFTWSVLQH